MPFSKLSKPFYFIRHGVTDANQQKLWCGGSWDIDLNETGLMQAKNAAHDIAGLASQIDVIFSSPMKRALRTTELINSIAQKPVVVVESLREWKVGEWEKTPWKNSLLGTSISKWVNPPGGETVEQFQNRIQTAFLECLGSDRRALISSHGAVGRVLLHLLQISERHIDNCKIHKFSPLKTSGGLKWEIE
jgi:broad specificity phosphatase PhoE